MKNKDDANDKNPKKPSDSKLIDQIKKISSGEYSAIPKPTSNDDKLGAALYELANHLHEISEIAYYASVGDYVKRQQTDYGFGDRLALSINALVNELKEVIRQVNIISSGKFCEEKQPDNKDDTLVTALNNMTNYLRESLSKNKSHEKDLKLSNTKLRILASTDPLTQVHNRLDFSNRFAQLLALSKRKHRICAVVLIDIDKFKSINDRAGHAVGDEVLCKFAKMLTHTVRESDSVIRMGGDEFAIILSELNTPDEVHITEKNILSALKQTTFTKAYSKAITFSMGIACFPRDGETQIELLKHADVELYKEKRLKKVI